MVIAKVCVNGVCAEAVEIKKIPVGIIGAAVSFEYTDPMWDSLTKTVVFRGAVTRDVLNAGKTVTIPVETVSRPHALLRVGVYGTDASGNVAIPTLWAELGIVRDAADPSGDPGTDPELPIWAQLQADVEALKQGGTGGGGCSDSCDDIYILRDGETLDDVPDNVDLVIDPNGEPDEEETAPGADGGYYMPAVTQQSDDTVQFNFAPSKPDMPAMKPTQVKLPAGPKGDDYILTDADKNEIAGMVEVKKFVLLNDFVSEEAVSSVEFSEADDGTPYDLIATLVVVSFPYNKDTYGKVNYEDDNVTLVIGNVIHPSRCGVFKTQRQFGKVEVERWWANNASDSGRSEYSTGFPIDILMGDYKKVTRIKLYTNGGEAANFAVKIWGVRA